MQQLLLWIREAAADLAAAAGRRQIQQQMHNYKIDGEQVYVEGEDVL